MQDALAMIQALECLHAVTIHVALRPTPAPKMGNWMLELHAVSDSATPMAPAKRYLWSREFGSHAIGDLGSLIYNACYELEKMLQRGQWVQQELPT